MLIRHFARFYHLFLASLGISTWTALCVPLLMGKGTFLLKYYFTNPKQIEPNCNQPVASPQLNHPVHMTCICWKLTLQIPPTSGNFQLKDFLPAPRQKKKRQNWGTEILSICWSSKWKSKISRFSSDKKGQQLEATLDCLGETRPNILETTTLSKRLPSLSECGSENLFCVLPPWN